MQRVTGWWYRTTVAVLMVLLVCLGCLLRGAEVAEVVVVAG
jgi:hypothetical protein